MIYPIVQGIHLLSPMFVFMYDILLHQVAPNWDDFITKWAAKTRVLVIYNQNWAMDAKTVRFVDRGAEWYKKHVFHTSGESVDQWFSTLDDFDHKMGRKRRDVFLFWQWGITTKDLIAHVESLGFRLDYFDNHGAFAPAFPWIQNEAFIFVRK